MTETIRDALVRFRRENGLRGDEEGRRIWLATLGTLILPLPNFRWRREIVAMHDAHHLITGYPVTVEGEFYVAAWEFGIGCYASRWARMLCTCLMACGLMSQPRQAMSAYRKGRGLRDQYAEAGGGGLLDLDLRTARDIVARNQNAPSPFSFAGD